MKFKLLYLSVSTLLITGAVSQYQYQGYHHHVERELPLEYRDYDLPIYFRGYKRSNDPTTDSAVSGVTNIHHKINYLVSDLKQEGSHPGASAVTNFITGVDGEIDHLVGVSGQVAPSTTGTSNAALEEVLGPTFQSLGDGIQLLIGNLAGGVLDVALVPALHQLSGSLTKVSSLAIRSNLNEYSNKFNALKDNVDVMANKDSKKKSHHMMMMHKRTDDPINNAAQEITYARKEIDNLVGWLKSEPLTRASVMQFAKAFEAGLNDATKGATDSMSGAGDNTKMVNSALLGPLFQSSSNGVEVLVSTFTTIKMDKELSEQLVLISKQIDGLSLLAQKYELKDYSNSLSNMSRKLNNVASAASSKDKAARDNDIASESMAGFVTAQQKIKAITDNLRSGPEHPTEEVLTDSITGIDDQIDKVVGMISTAAVPATGGASTSVEEAILGSTFQTITDGAEAVAGKVGAVADIAVVPSVHIMASNLSNLSLIARNYKMNDLQEKFTKQSQQLTHAAVQGQKAYQHQKL